jgi:hypothetical protein
MCLSLDGAKTVKELKLEIQYADGANVIKKQFSSSSPPTRDNHA